MGKTALNLSPEERRTYRPAEAISRRNIEQRATIDRRRERAWEIAKIAASRLRKEYGAKRVIVFGSLAHRSWFTQWSDIDIAAWGITPSRFYAAAASIENLDTSFHIDLLDPETAPSTILEHIEREGVEL
jgi:predicted nucleotidyltransferase